ncbi:hypothetical protein R3W88_014149 [Solanum pinnatisectum]|uniref:Uncharacterized protein n=1 Tax=Solanum pinnatisectum TaxID=50273 RepID=A0AAV9KQS1_9SOLN|nr:hypothetical protein R3W88_014149 [Solanum pinnatisectum]
MDAQPNSVGQLAYLTDDDILDRFDRISFFLTIQNNGAFDQDLLASPIGFRLNLIAYLSGANKRESFRMGSSSDAEPMREGEAGIDSFQEPARN